MKGSLMTSPAAIASPPPLPVLVPVGDTTDLPPVPPPPPPLPGIIPIVGARGGIGASTFSLFLARALSLWGQRVVLIDADTSGSLAFHVNLPAERSLRWADLPAHERHFRPGKLLNGLPLWGTVPLLTGDARGGAASQEQVIAAAHALAEVSDIVLIDWPRGVQPPDSGMVLICAGSDLISAAGARALATRLEADEAYLVLREGESDLDDETLQRLTGCDVLGHIPMDRSIAQRSLRGLDVTRGRGKARKAARDLAITLLEILQPAPAKQRA